MYKIIFEKYAKQHLIDILTFYTLQGGLFLAEKNKNKLSAQIDRLKTYPTIYPICEIEPRLHITHHNNPNPFSAINGTM